MKITSKLLKLTGENKIEETIEELLKFTDKYYTRFTPDVILISSRFKAIKTERLKGIIKSEDYRFEENSITDSLIQIITSLDGVEENIFKKKKNKKDVLVEIENLNSKFEDCRKDKTNIQSNHTRLREKNEIARDLGEIFMNHPELIKHYTKNKKATDGIIAGIANRYKRVPEASCIDFFERNLKNISGNFTKCCISNALAELIYSGQVWYEQDERIKRILVEIFPDSSPSVRQNVNRVYTEIDYFISE